MVKPLLLSILLICLFVLVTVLIFTAGEKQVDYLYEHNTVVMIFASIIFFGFFPIFLFALPWLPRYFKRRWLLTNGVATRATITAIHETGTTINNNPVVKLDLRVESDSGSKFDAVGRQLISRFARPRIGDVVLVMYDPNKPTDLVVLSDMNT